MADIVLSSSGPGDVIVLAVADRISVYPYPRSKTGLDFTATVLIGTRGR
jgi:hypothetical protein